MASVGSGAGRIVVEPVLRLQSLRKQFGGLVVTEDVTLDIMPGELHAVIGPNGAGKTTLINQISGLIACDEGRIWFAGADITHAPVHMRAALGLARSFQMSSVLPTFTVLENVALAVQARSGSSFRFTGRVASEASVNEPAFAVLAQVGLRELAAAPAGALAHGQQRALELAIALAMEPKLLLLDEPMAGTGREEAARLVRVLYGLKGRFSMVLIEHDMDAVFALADRISVLIYGRVLASGPPEQIRLDPRVIAAYLGDQVE
jgi:branched-chain amino acid transport system ATP-binding protein